MTDEGTQLEDIRTVAAQVLALVDELAPLCEELVAADTHHKVTRERLGIPDRRPDAAALLVDVLHGRLGRALRPWAPYVCAESAERAANMLVSGRFPDGSAIADNSNPSLSGHAPILTMMGATP